MLGIALAVAVALSGGGTTGNLFSRGVAESNPASASESPVAEIMREQFGPVWERPFLAVIAVAFFGAALVAVASTSRYIFAMARDGRFPAHRVMQRVNPRTHTPIPATLLVLAIGVVLMVVLPGAALIQLISTGNDPGYLALRHDGDSLSGGAPQVRRR